MNKMMIEILYGISNLLVNYGVCNSSNWYSVVNEERKSSVSTRTASEYRDIWHRQRSDVTHFDNAFPFLSGLFPNAQKIV